MTFSNQLTVKSRSHEAFILITGQVADNVKQLEIKNGIVHLFVLHTTCGLTINENADPNVVHDLLSRLNSFAPWQSQEDSHLEGNSAAHLKSSLMGPSLTIPVKNSKLVLGTWQGIFLGEFDGPRNRTIHITALNST